MCTGDLAHHSGLTTGRNSDGDLQRDLDAQVDASLRRHLSKPPIAALASEEMHEPQIGSPEGRICVAINPLDGSSNIDINMTVVIIFSILPAPDDLAFALRQPGSAQLAATFSPGQRFNQHACAWLTKLQDSNRRRINTLAGHYCLKANDLTSARQMRR
ncbi:hypothetical protein [Bradyrhizobium arachidis]|uniref:hypothetical protein n=1 Tax=Bradyrhizobium arachidis TaxID=858423 RepID=UPI001E28560A|nr:MULTISPECIES: hypothetical protein [Bradyrhizobium]UFW53753.1 hypothetical protein BaraCB756_09400 [Bradyrhizobium arachidis]